MLLFLLTFYFKNSQINLVSNYLKKADSDTVDFWYSFRFSVMTKNYEILQSVFHKFRGVFKTYLNIYYGAFF